MLQLKQVDFNAVSKWFYDYQKKSKNYEMPPDYCEFWGIHRDAELIGYFATIAYKNMTVEINQGYLVPAARHKTYNRIAMRLLEDLIKQKGFKRITLATNRAVGSYQKFMRECGFDLVRAEFAKEVV